jgi:PIN domain nuclease of toxin-antitoxin system
VSGSASARSRYVLDSFALLAYLGDEAGAAQVEEILQAAGVGRADIWMSVINLGEVLYTIERELGLETAQRAAAIVDQLPLRVVDADRPQTFAAAHIKANHTLAYADAFVIALAQELDGAIVTGDPEFRLVESWVSVCWLDR